MTALLESLGIRDRAGVEAFIERLIAMLDDMDPDPDMEPWLGWNLAVGSNMNTDDREGDDEREHDEAELYGIGDLDGLIEQVSGYHGAAI